MTVTFAAMLLFIAEIATYRTHGGAIERLAAGIFTLVFIGLPMACIVSLRLLCRDNLGPEQTGQAHLGPGHLGMLPLVSLVAVAKAGDIAAYLGGSLVGSAGWPPRSALAKPGRGPSHRWRGRLLRPGLCWSFWLARHRRPGLGAGGSSSESAWGLPPWWAIWLSRC